MKQGTASHSGSGSTKSEPISHAVNPGAVSQIGLATGRMADVKPLYEGRGLKAPMVGTSHHKAGSQHE